MPQFLVCDDVFEQQYPSCMMVSSGGNFGLGREYHKKLFGPMFYSWWNCPLSKISNVMCLTQAKIVLVTYILFTG